MIRKRLGIVGGAMLLIAACNQDLGGADMATPEDLAMAEDLTQTLKGSCDLRKYSPAQQECRDYESTSSQFITTQPGRRHAGPVVFFSVWTHDASGGPGQVYGGWTDVCRAVTLL